MIVRTRACESDMTGAPAPRPRHRRAEPTARGFTIVELVVVLAILSVAAAIAIPRYGASISRFRAESAARRIAGDLAYARSAAQSASASSSVQFDTAAGTYTVTGATNIDTRAVGYKVTLGEDPYHASLVLVAMGPSSRVSFDGYGRPDTGGRVVVGTSAAHWEVTVEEESGAIRVQRVP